MRKRTKKIINIFLYSFVFVLVAQVVSIFSSLTSQDSSRHHSTTPPQVPPIAYADSPHTTDGDSCDDTGGDTCDSSGGDSSGCFIAGTKILLFDGREVSIEMLRSGDLVQGREGVFMVNSVVVHDGVQGFSHSYKNSPLMVIVFEDGNRFFTVGSHPLYFNNGDGWVWSRMSHLKTGSLVQTISGKTVAVRSVDYIHRSIRPVVYDIDLDVTENQPRSYYANGILTRDVRDISKKIKTWVPREESASYDFFDYLWIKEDTLV